MIVGRLSAEVFTVSTSSLCSPFSPVWSASSEAAKHSVHGGANFVAHIGEELAFGAAGAFGLDPGFFQLARAGADAVA